MRVLRASLCFLMVTMFSACGVIDKIVGSDTSSPTGAGNDAGGGGAGTTIVGQSPGVLPNAPVLPLMTNVVGYESEDSVGIEFEPVDGAVDYRVYPMPNASDVSASADGSVTIKNAIYRCGGTRQTFDMPNNLNSNWLTVSDTQETFSDPSMIAGQYSATATISATPDGDTLGYVYTAPDAGLVPVYAVGVTADSFEHAWRSGRPKIYTTDATERATLLSKGGRDDGIVFYVPTASASTQTIYGSKGSYPTSVSKNKDCDYQFYFGESKKSSHQSDPTPPASAFSVLTSQAPGSVPLLSVEIGRNGGQCHTELAPGLERYKLAANQGRSPLWHVEWSGITAPTTLVVEALKSGCPFQGLLAPQSLPALTNSTHQQFFTLDDLKAQSPTGEVFINGQYDTTVNPQAIARSFVNVTPQPHDPSQWDWYQGFTAGTDFGPVTNMSCAGDPCVHVQTSTFDLWGSSLDIGNDSSGTQHTVFTYGQFLGQFWLAYDDWEQDVTAPVRLTAMQQANMSSDPNSYLHVTMSTDIVTTGRRYPQIIISDMPMTTSNATYKPILIGNLQGTPLDINPNNWLIVQPIADGWDVHAYISMQAFHGANGSGTWAINNQYPAEHLLLSEGDDPPPPPWPPYEPIMEHTGLDRMATFDVFLSSSKIYVLMDGTPIACRQWPSSVVLQGPVSVTFGDTMYHEGADTDLSDGHGNIAFPTPMPFVAKHMGTEGGRHFDNLGFKNGVAAPTWDINRFPCPATTFSNSD